MDKLLELIRGVVRALVVGAIREMIQGLVVGLLTGLGRLIVDALAERFGSRGLQPEPEPA